VDSVFVWLDLAGLALALRRFSRKIRILVVGVLVVNVRMLAITGHVHG
jgi:hypothetical protein